MTRHIGAQTLDMIVVAVRFVPTDDIFTQCCESKYILISCIYLILYFLHAIRFCYYYTHTISLMK